MNRDQDFDLRVGRWLDAREAPVVGKARFREHPRDPRDDAPGASPDLPPGPDHSPTAPPPRRSGGPARRRWPGGRHRTRRPTVTRIRPASDAVGGPDQHAGPVSARGSPDRPWGRHVAGPRDPVPGLGPGRRPGHRGYRSCHWAAGSDGRRGILDIPGGRRALGPEGRGAAYSCASIRRPDASSNGSRGSPGSPWPRTATRSGVSTRTAMSSESTWRPEMSSGRLRSQRSPSRSCSPRTAVWVACDAGNALVRIDPEAYEVIDTVDVGFGPVELELGFDSLWVRNRQLELVRIDPETAEVIATITGFGTSPSLGLSFGGGYVWASEPDWHLGRRSRHQ